LTGTFFRTNNQNVNHTELRPETGDEDSSKFYDVWHDDT